MSYQLLKNNAHHHLVDITVEKSFDFVQFNFAPWFKFYHDGSTVTVDYLSGT
ncbi:hypothetical protein [Lacticaseibacillus paracasei]|uniref:Uncharacterized protein n=1 Tax=Lacticaseibacillus paracasei NRIC 0644 TaxID=1435038 RepID=A0A0C9NYK6_LACPA|nr:hypothetical protein [Lacticaseibacillus paracasei]GAN37110.1 hypothetical protein LC0644_1699 [Lacticaseibacillus paracasei NRIC 0644]GAN40394.1 hypothetical protein LC1917_2271 [Lacticaseibacillus paracasei NRIC 1917]